MKTCKEIVMENFKAIDAQKAVEKYDLMQLNLSEKHESSCRRAALFSLLSSLAPLHPSPSHCDAGPDDFIFVIFLFPLFSPSLPSHSLSLFSPLSFSDCSHRDPRRQHGLWLHQLDVRPVGCLDPPRCLCHPTQRPLPHGACLHLPVWRWRHPRRGR